MDEINRARTDPADAVLNFCCRIGKAMIQCGAEIYRVEDSLEHILQAYGYQEMEVFAIPSSILITIQDGNRNCTKSVRIRSASNHMRRLQDLNQLSRNVCRERPTLAQAEEMLSELLAKPDYPVGVSFAGYAAAAAFFTLFWGGNGVDALIAACCGLLIKMTLLYTRKVHANIFFTNVVACMLMAILPILLQKAGLQLHQDKVLIGSIMLLVPGLAITNVIRDVLAGDFLTALSKFAEVLLVSLAIAIGIALPLAAAARLF